jgi:hypothetical protein
MVLYQGTAFSRAVDFGHLLAPKGVPSQPRPTAWVTGHFCTVKAYEPEPTS